MQHVFCVRYVHIHGQVQFLQTRWEAGVDVLSFQ